MVMFPIICETVQAVIIPSATIYLCKSWSRTFCQLRRNLQIVWMYRQTCASLSIL